MTDHEPDYQDLDDETLYGWCETCAKEVVLVKRDFGTGERMGSLGYHIDMQDCCGDCGERL